MARTKKNEGPLKVVKEEPLEVEQLAEGMEDLIALDEPVEETLSDKPEVSTEERPPITKQDIVTAHQAMSMAFFGKGQKVIEKYLNLGMAIGLPFKLPMENPQGFYITRLLYVPADNAPTGLVDVEGRSLNTKAKYSSYPAMAVCVNNSDFGKVLFLDYDFWNNLFKGNHQHDRSFYLGAYTFHIIKYHEVYSVSNMDFVDMLDRGFLQLSWFKPSNEFNRSMELER